MKYERKSGAHVSINQSLKRRQRDKIPVRPDVSVVIASYNSKDYLESSVQSALNQEDVDLEVLIVDDGSTDGSLEFARALASQDTRIRVLQTSTNGGPAAARNRGLEAMCGDWFAVLDSDDEMYPDRLRRLIDIACAHGADVVADDLEVFGDSVSTERLVGSLDPMAEGWIEPKTYLDRSRMFARTTALGYLKPVISRAVIDRIGLRYNEEMRIGEDDDLILQLLSSQHRYWYADVALYRYRKHKNSISYRLSVDHAERMLIAERDIQARIGPELARSTAYRRRWKALVRGLAFVRSVDCLKKRDIPGFLSALISTPSAIILYKFPIHAAFRRLMRLGKSA